MIAIDYAQPTAALTPASIYGISRETHVYPNGYQSFRWRIDLGWPNGSITFLGEGFTQVLRASPVVSPHQCLSPAQRELLPSG